MHLWWVSSVPLVHSKIIDKEFALIAIIIVELIFVVLRHGQKFLCYWYFSNYVNILFDIFLWGIFGIHKLRYSSVQWIHYNRFCSIGAFWWLKQRQFQKCCVYQEILHTVHIVQHNIHTMNQTLSWMLRV
jgi:hypothetical protein